MKVSEAKAPVFDYIFKDLKQIGPKIFVDHRSPNPSDRGIFISDQVRYIRQMFCTGFNFREVPDRNGNNRQGIIFELAPLDLFKNEIGTIEDEEFKEDWQKDNVTLRREAIASVCT